MIYGLADKPLNLQQGSNGSSAGSASTVAGLVPLPLVQTYGSIVAPSAVCGAVASNIWQCCPNWGMNLAWTSDRIGPICSAEDCNGGIRFHTW
jgi:Asp-tRNA(Asn)/Glu-tRNA(Gln) amidotransferase A subunit family amidase